MLESRGPMSWKFSDIFEGWDKVFDKLLTGLEDKAAQVGSCKFEHKCLVYSQTTQD